MNRALWRTVGGAHVCSGVRPEHHRWSLEELTLSISKAVVNEVGPPLRCLLSSEVWEAFGTRDTPAPD